MIKFLRQYKTLKYSERAELVAIPTETVYGLAGNIYSETAIKKYLRTKKTASLQPIDRSYRFYGKLEEIVCKYPKARILAANF
jgi:L-threonylcarbamoyladenylate synthase